MKRHEVRTYEAASAVLRSTVMRQALYDNTATVLGRSIINLHGAEHRARRSEEAQIFRKDFFHYYETKILAPEIETTLARYVGIGNVDLVDLGYRLMVNLTADFAGVDRPDRSLEGSADLVRLLKTLTLSTRLDHSTLDDVGEIKAKLLAGIEEYRERYFLPSVAHRRAIIDAVRVGRRSEAEIPRDILSALLQGQDKLGMGLNDMLQESIFFLLAGAHTSVHTLTHVLNEMFAWLEAHPETRHRLHDDPFFIQRCVHECVRLHPSSPLAKRRAESSITLAPIGEIEEGDEVVIFLDEAGQDPTIYGADAANFSPDRETPPGKSPYGLSMGQGMHACLGLNLALGAVARPGADAETHHFGSVSAIVSALFAAGVQPDPAAAPRQDPTTTREFWTYFPVVFDP